MVGLGLEDIDKQLRRYLISPLIIYAEDILNHFFLINELIYLAVLVLVVACGIFHCGTLTLKLYLVVESWFSDQGSNQHSLRWKVAPF